MTGAISIAIQEGRGKKGRFAIGGEIPDDLTIEGFFDFNKLVTINTDHEIMKEELRKGFPVNHTTRVDGSKNKSPLNVKAFGRIERHAPVAAYEVLIKIYSLLLRRSVVDTGTYKSNHWVFMNGELIAKNSSELKSFLKSTAIQPFDKIRFVNLTPYARKMELRGKSIALKGKLKGNKVEKKRRRFLKSKGLTAKVPNGAYKLTEQAIKRSFKAIGFVRMVYISGSELESVLPRMRPTGKPFGTKFAPNKKYRKGSAGRPYLYPSIVVRFSKEGIIQDAKL